MSATLSISRFTRPAAAWRNSLKDPIRTIQLLLLIVILGYGARQDNLSPFTVSFMENVIGSAFSGVEIAVIVVLFLEIIRRLAARNPYLNRTPITIPMLLIGIVLCVYPFVHMLITENGLRFPLELNGMPVLVLCFFLYVHMFRRKEVAMMGWLLIAVGIYKAIEGLAIFGTVGLRWGLLSGWRDGALLALMIMGALLAWFIPSNGDRLYSHFRRALFLAFPIVLFTFTNSTRRSFILGVAASLIVIGFYLRRDERSRLYATIPLVVAGVLAAAFLSGRDQFLDRMSSISNPSSEGSTAYRLIEVYNIARAIQEKPLFGWPYGQRWQNYTMLEFEMVSDVTPHNTYLYVAWRAGLLGLVTWIGFLVVLVRTHHRTVKGARTRLERFIALWLYSCTISVIIAGVTSPITTDHMQTFFPFLLAMTSLLPGALRNARGADSPPMTTADEVGALQTP